MALVVEGAHRLGSGGRNGGNHHIAPIDMIGLEVDVGLGLTASVGRTSHHVDFLFGLDSGYGTVVAHADKQAAAHGIGKCRHRTRQFAGVGDFVLEVLLPVLALSREVVYVLTVVAHSG